MTRLLGLAELEWVASWDTKGNKLNVSEMRQSEQNWIQNNKLNGCKQFSANEMQFENSLANVVQSSISPSILLDGSPSWLSSTSESTTHYKLPVWMEGQSSIVRGGR